MINKEIAKIKSNENINGNIIKETDLLEVDLLLNKLITSFDAEKELLQNSEKIDFIKNAKTEFTSYNFNKLKEDIKQMSKDGTNEVFKTAINNITNDLKSNVDNIILDISNGNINTIKQLYGENEKDFEINVLSVLKNKLNSLETKINTKIFPLIVDSLNLLQNNDLEKIEKNYILLEEIKKLEAENGDISFINEKKENLIKDYFFEEQFSEELFIKRKGSLDRDFYNNMKNINIISSIKELFGDFLNSENIKLISTGRGQTIIYKFVYKIIADLLITNSLKIETSSSYLFKNISKKNNNFDENILNKINTIKSVNNIEKDYAVSLFLTEIEQTLEIKDLSLSSVIKKVLYEKFHKINKSVSSITSFSKDDIEKKYNEKSENLKKLIEEKYKGYKEDFNKFNKVLDKKTEQILTIDEKLYNINKSFQNIEEITIDNIEELKNLKINYQKFQEETDKKIQLYKEIIKEIENKITLLNQNLGLNNEDIEYVLKEQKIQQNILEIVYKELKKEESVLTLISNLLNNKNVISINNITSSSSKYESEIKEINNQINKIKEVVDFNEIKNSGLNFKNKITSDLKEIKNLPETLKNEFINSRKEVIKFEDFKELNNNIKEIFNLSKERIEHKNSKNYLNVVSHTIKTYGYKENLEEYFQELSEVANKKLEIFQKLDERIKYMQYLESILSKYPKEILEDNNEKKIKKEFLNIISDIEKYKLELLNYLTEKNNKGINQNMYDIDNELKSFMTKKAHIKEIQIMSIIKGGTEKRKPKINENCIKMFNDTIKIEKDIKQEVIFSIKNQIGGIFYNDKQNKKIKTTLNLNNVKNYRYDFGSKIDYIKKIFKISNNNEFKENIYEDEKYSYVSEYNFLKENRIKRFFTLKDEKNINKNVETLIEDFNNSIPKEKRDKSEFSIFKHINEITRLNINSLSKLEYQAINIIKDGIKRSYEIEKTTILEAQNRKNIEVYFESLVTKLIGLEKNPTIKTNLLKLIKDNTEKNLKTISNIQDKFLLKKNLNNILNESLNDLYKQTELKILGNDIDISKNENFNKNFNPKDIESIKEILENEKYIDYSHKQEITKNLIKYVNIQNNFQNKTLEQSKNEIINRINVYINKNIKQEIQVFVNTDNDSVLDKILDNNNKDIESENLVTQQIYLIEEVASSKIKELNIKKELGKKLKLYSENEISCIDNNIYILGIYLKQIKKDFSYQFNKKSISLHYETEKYISQINGKSSEQLIEDLIKNRNKEESYLEDNSSETIFANNLDIKDELKEILSSKNNEKKQAFYSYFVKTSDEIDKLFFTNKDKNISILLFNNNIKNSDIEKNLFKKIETINENSFDLFKDYDIDKDEEARESKKNNIKKDLINLHTNLSNNQKKIVEMLIKCLDYSEEYYLKNFSRIQELNILVNKEIDFKISQKNDNNLQM